MMFYYNYSVFLLICVVFNCVNSSIMDLFAHRLETGSRDMSNLKKYNRRNSDKIVDSPAIKLIEKYKYPAESHVVQTEDGYLLTIHRIANPGKPVVLLQHGLLASSDTWLLQGAGKDLAFFLFDNGYDVWLSNIRGNYYSRRHVVLDPDRDQKFWEFSYHEIGYYDLPAIIDYTLNTTKQKSLFYIGHSMGTTVFFVLCSTRPEYNSKITLFHGLAPAAFIIHKPSPIWQLALSNAPQLIQTCIDQNMYEIFPKNQLNARLGRALCVKTAPTQPLCLAGLFVVIGVDYQQMNSSLLPKLFEHYPAGGSLNTFRHFYQNVIHGTFRQFDYGENENLIRYKRKDPPEYNLKKITVPVILFYGDGDFIIKREDAEMVGRKLPNLISIFKVPFRFFNHLDFLTGTDSKSLLYDQILLIIEKYTKQLG